MLKVFVLANIAGDHAIDLPGFKKQAQPKVIYARVV